MLILIGPSCANWSPCGSVFSAGFTSGHIFLRDSVSREVVPFKTANEVNQFHIAFIFIYMYVN